MQTLTKQQRQVLGMDTLSSGKREILLERIGRTVFDNTVVRLLETLNDEQIHALNYALESCESYESVMSYLQTAHPKFGTYLQETQEKFVATCVESMQATV